MSEKFTPGPWGNNGGTVESAAGWHVATAHGNGGGQLDNAYLISAAPDMYAVLSELEESSYWSEYDVPIGIAARILAALKKARGEA